MSLIFNSPREAFTLYQHDDPHKGDPGQTSGNLSGTSSASTATSHESILKSKDGRRINDGSNDTPRITAPCNTQTSTDRKQTASNDQTNTIQGSSTQQSRESMERSKQQPRENENGEKNKHQCNTQQSNNEGNNELNGNKDHQDKQPNDDQQKNDQRNNEQEDKSDESDEGKISEDDDDRDEELAEDEHQEEEDSEHNQGDRKGKSNSSAAGGSACLDLTSNRPNTTGRVRFLDESLKIQGITVWYPAPREKKFTSLYHGSSFGGPTPEMLKPSKSKHLSMERPSTSSGFVSVDRILSEKAEAKFKKAYEKKCKQQQDERINGIEDLPVSSEPCEINLLDRKFYYDDDGTENLYDGPEEIAAKLGLEYEGSPIITIYPSSITMKQYSGSSSPLPRFPARVETKPVMLENHKHKDPATPTRITLAAY
ncbi:unnamed protein product [Mucor fragilis]